MYHVFTCTLKLSNQNFDLNVHNICKSVCYIHNYDQMYRRVRCPGYVTHSPQLLQYNDELLTSRQYYVFWQGYAKIDMKQMVWYKQCMNRLGPIQLQHTYSNKSDWICCKRHVIYCLLTQAHGPTGVWYPLMECCYPQNLCFNTAKKHTHKQKTVLPKTIRNECTAIMNKICWLIDFGNIDIHTSVCTKP